MKILQKTYTLIACLVVSAWAWGQKRNVVNDTLRSESVVIVKSYNPTINDAFKIQDTPSFEDPNKDQKQNLNYRIHSVPVASTFIPKKAKAIEVEKEKQEKGTANYARLAAGNFTNVEAEVFVAIPTDKKSQFTAHLDHQSSQGGIKNVKLDDGFFDTALRLGFDRFEKLKQFNGQLEVKHQLYNWYGLDKDLNITQDQINQIDPAHSFLDINLKGDLVTDSEYIEGGSLLLRHFRDDFESTENHFVFSPKLRFEERRRDMEIQVPVRLEYLQNTFKGSFQNIEQSIFIIGAAPGVGFNIMGADIRAGLKARFATNELADENKPYIYPDILATYKLFKYDFNMFAKITGDLDTNSYRSLSEENLFVAPELVTNPTNRTYDAKLGINGSLLNFLGFEAYVNFKNEENYAFFAPSAELFTVSATTVESYDYGNAFNVIYGDLKTTNVHVNANVDFDKKYGASLELDYNKYTFSRVPTNYYLPKGTATFNGYYVVNPKWKVNSTIFFVSGRLAADPLTGTTTDLEKYVDINLQVDYKINDKWTAFVKGKNLANQEYQRWLNYPVQTAQGLIGARYNFDIKK